MSGFCDGAWAGTADLRAAIHALPFNRELAAGTLTPERFRFYILQDAIYLGQFARVLAIAAAKAPDAATVQNFVHSALGAIAGLSWREGGAAVGTRCVVSVADGATLLVEFRSIRHAEKILQT
jgi:hypothetical protein